ncbi:MAG: FG-GAP repeat protein [Candidatus Methanofastidiosum methylothiophilum]|uniref:FG-GAP repeat protein n=1 Tax=Candidatus Methanofastidiosum methylothiophilum TaxID=1705564 RepID=A0A150J4Y2_9EURY|nr:MAG: FG-GAP repeat protein [Candidatus Methanofastidiosum methylthiophilus]NMC76950.1 VCBS repeat-containing protein [Candidatus Methanofastidiosa archaeon]
MQKRLALVLTLIFIFANFSHIYSEDLIKWRYHTADDIKEVALGDVDGDGRFDIVIGSGNYVYVLDVFGQEIWKRKTINFVNSVSSNDLDGDGRSDIAVGLINNGIEVFNSDGEKLWEYWMPSSIQKVIIKDIESDGYGEVIAISHNQTFVDNAWVVLNHDGCVRFQSKEFFFPNIELLGYYSGTTKKWEGDDELRTLLAEDINGDGNTEFIATTRLNDILVFDYNMNSLWGYHFDYPITSVSLGDLEGDGFKEILLGVNKTLILLTKDGFSLDEYKFDGDIEAATAFKDEFNTSYVVVGKGNTLYAYDSSKELFNYRFDDTINLIYYDNLDYKNEFEIITGTDDGAYVISPKGKKLFTYRTYSPVKEIFAVNLNYKGEKEFVIGSTDVDAITYKEFQEIQIPTTKTNQQAIEATLKKANAIFNTGKALYEAREYQSAIDRFKEARTLYQSVSNNEGAANCGTYISNSTLYIQAKSFEDQGLLLKNEKKYEESKSNYQTAKDIYSSLNDNVKIQEMDQKITELDDLIKTEALFQMITYVVIIGGVIGLIIGILLFLRRRKKKSKGA